MVISKHDAQALINWFKFAVMREGKRAIYLDGIRVLIDVQEDNTLEETDMTLPREIIKEVCEATGSTFDTSYSDKKVSYLDMIKEETK